MLKVKDTIKCANAEDLIKTMQELAKENIQTDFIYEKDGEKGLWLEVIKVGVWNVILSRKKRYRFFVNE